MSRSFPMLGIATLAYAAILEVMIYAAIRFFPNFEEHFETLRILAGISTLQGLMTQIEQGGAVAYVCAQQFFKGVNTLGTAAAVLFAVGAVAGEVHRGTFELWLSRPCSRARLLAERYAAGAVATVLPVFVTSATIPGLCADIGEEVLMGPMLRCSVQAGALLLAIYSLTFLASSLGSNPTRIALVALFFTTFSFAIYMVEVLTHYSIYRWSDIEVYMKICNGDGLPWGKLAALLGISAAAFAGSVAAVSRRVP
jgi:ABC-type transport system involved in multi-copper enzyme maturation permease subunit